VQLSDEAERKLADQRMKEWSKDQEEYAERECQEVHKRRNVTQPLPVEEKLGLLEEEDEKIAEMYAEEEGLRHDVNLCIECYRERRAAQRFGDRGRFDEPTERTRTVMTEPCGAVP
jgi:hypothetical protein